MVADKGKKQKVAAEKGGDVQKSPEQVDGELVVSIEKLQEIQDQLEKINEQASDEVLEIEQKYNKVRKPVYDKRKEVIQAIPDFWLTAFLSHPALSQLLTDEDQKIFKHLESLEVEESKDVKLGYTISFNFNSNPYFEDSKLSKTFNFLDEGTVKVISTSIKWKEGMGIPNGANNEGKGNKRPLEEESFFSWFEESEDMDEMNDEIAEIIKEDLWPNPLSYFNNEGDEDFDGDEDDEEDKDDDDDSEDGDDDDQDEE
uniref:Uncharacterized protein n=1 Tax=Kalanchoe fedtschenkoi TaxID=63787 RepID=A0A7N0TWN0_KALFE